LIGKIPGRFSLNPEFLNPFKKINSKIRMNMRTSYLDYYKLILDKVCFRDDLLRKEYRKAMNRLEESEQAELKRWLHDRGYPGLLFTDEHQTKTVREPVSDLKNLTV
jgi:hypothetical protein